MKLLRLEVRHFGKLEDFVLEPKAGLNFYCRPNEFGKTTLIYFIYYMFYGYNAKMLKKYLPWSGAEMAGSLTFSLEGREWRIERRHPAKGMEKRQILCLTTGEEKTFANQEQPGPYFLGLDGETFLRSFCITQGDLLFSRTDGLDVALKNMAATGDENVSYQQAEDFLHKEHAKYMYRGKTQGPLLNLKEKLAAEIAALNEARRSLDGRIADHRAWEELEKAIPESDGKVQALRVQLKKAEGSDARKLLEKLEALRQKKPMDPPAVSKERLNAWDAAYHEKQDCEEARLQAEQEKDRLSEQLALVQDAAGQFGFHALSGQELEKLKKKSGFPWWTVPFLAAILADAGAMLMPEMVWLYAVGAVLLMAALALLLGGRLHRRRICHAYGAANEAQLTEKWEKYQQVLAQQEQLKATLRAAAEEAESRKKAAETAGARLEALRAETRIFSPEELQEQKILWGVYENSLKQDPSALQEQTLLGGRSREELEALAEGAELLEITAHEVRAELSRAEEENRALRVRRDGLDPKALERRWNEIREMTKMTSAMKKEVRQGEARLLAVQTALGWLKEANEEMNTHFAPQLCSLAGTHLERLTAGRYRALLLDSKFGISLETSEGTYPIEVFSAGTRDAVYFAFRLAVSELLSETVLPMVLDDPFTNLDDDRRKAAEQLLQKAAESRQILHFSCRE